RSSTRVFRSDSAKPASSCCASSSTRRAGFARFRSAAHRATPASTTRPWRRCRRRASSRPPRTVRRCPGMPRCRSIFNWRDDVNTHLGFAHFLSQSDAVGQVLLAILIAMSVASWAIIAVKGLTLVLRKGRSSAFLDFFWNARSLEAVAGEIATHGARDPFSHLTSHAMHAQAHHARYGAAKLEEAGTSSEFVTRTIKKVLDEETTRLDNGLAVLATVGATAPFVGLFGTVWGV